MGVGYTQTLPSPFYDLALSKGIHALNMGRYEEALSAFQEALSVKPQDIKATYHLGVAQRSMGRYEAADETLKAVAARDPSFQPVHFDLGTVAYHLGHYDEALKELLLSESSGSQTDTRQAMTQYYLGLTFHKLERFREAAPRFLRTAALSPGLAVNARYFAGVAFYRQGILDEAKDAFDEVIQTAPGSSLVSSSRRFLEGIERARPQTKRWAIAASLGAQYDSNVLLWPEDAPLPEEVSDETDLRWVGTVQGSLKIVEAARWDGTARYSFYESRHQDLDRFDVQNHDLGLILVHRPSPRPYRFEFSYHVSDAWVDQENYLQTQMAGATVDISKNQVYLMQVEYRYQNKNFLRSDAFPGNEDRTGINHAVGFHHTYFFSKQNGNLHGGYTYDQESTRGEDWDYQGYRLNLGLLLPSSVIGGWMQPVLESEVGTRLYKNPNSLSDKTPLEEREDRIQVHALTLSRSFTSWLSGSVQYLYNINASNIEVYDYDRQITSVSVTAAF